MLHIVLVEPEIPPNTGNIIRLCANTGASLHLIHPLGFEFDDKRLRRAGLDYAEFSSVHHHDSWDQFLHSAQDSNLPMYALTTKSKSNLYDFDLSGGGYFIFGPETRGLSLEQLHSLNESNWLRIPMMPQSRSLNLSNTVAICLYEALRQSEFQGLI